MLILGLGFLAPRPVNAVSSSSCTPTADFDVSPDPSFLVLQAGATGTSKVTVTPIDGFNQAISLAAAKITTGLSVSLSASSIDVSAGPAAFTVTVTTSTSITSGDYTFNVNATTATTLFHDPVITVFVPKVPTAGLGLTSDKEFVTILQGSPDTATITLESLHGMPDATVTLTGTASSSFPGTTPPTVTLTPPSVPLSSGGTITSILTIQTSSAPPTTTPGFYSIKVTGTAIPGGFSNSTTISVDVIVPGFSLDATPPTLDIAAGSSALSIINVTSYGSFTGTVALSSLALSAPPSPTGSLSLPSVVVPADSHVTSDLTISVDASVPPGTYSILVTGTSGLINQAVYVSVTVPGISITGPATITVPQAGTSVPSTITLASLNGLTDTVGLSINCDPTGLTADITPASVSVAPGSPGSATLTISASSFTAPGNYTVEVDASGTSVVAFNSTNIKVIVTGPDFTLTAAPSIVYLTTGATTTATITATSKMGFSRTINLEASVFSLTGPGLSASLSKSTLTPTGSSDSATLTLTASATGLYGIEITGTSWPIVHKTEVGADATAPTPDFSLTTSSASLTIMQGETVIPSIGLNSIAGFTGSVALSITAPTGITATPSPVSISGTGTSDLTVSVASSVSPGSYTVDVKGTSGALVHHAIIMVTVTSSSPTLDFTISATTPVSFTSGTTGTSTVNIAGTNGFFGYVTLTASIQSGLTVAFSPTTLYPGKSTATFSSSTPGSYTVTITGTSGSLVHTTNIQVSVTAVGTPDFTIAGNPATLTIQAGNTGTSTITITPSYGFVGTVALTTMDFLNGPLGSLSATSISGGSGASTLTINVASSVRAGTYTVTVQGTSGSLAHSTHVTIAVTSPPSTQPASTAPTIFGLSPPTFYGTIGVIIALIVVGGVAVVLRGRKP